MPHDRNAPLWPNDSDSFFHDRRLKPRQQAPKQCVATTLAMLTDSDPERFVGRINTQDPRSWSAAIAEWGMRLAYCPTDARQLRYYRDELLSLDDLFTISYYTPVDPADILKPPAADGWVCGSHVVLLHRGTIFDPQHGFDIAARDHWCWDHHTKRIFRVVPAGYPSVL